VSSSGMFSGITLIPCVVSWIMPVYFLSGE
jgi:hypothetical protein